MLEKIVVGVDGSASSMRSVDWCVRSFSGTDTEVLVVTCFVVRSELGTAGNGELRDRLRPFLDEACAKLDAAGVRCRGLVIDGDARSALLETATSENAELIVVGSRGRSQLTNLMLGSVASYLTHQSPLPVTVVR